MEDLRYLAFNCLFFEYEAVLLILTYRKSTYVRWKQREQEYEVSSA